LEGPAREGDGEMRARDGSERRRMEMILDPGDFCALGEIWDRAALKMATYVPFLMHDWFLLWNKHFLQKNKLRTVVLFEGNEAALIAPLMERRDRVSGLRVRKLELIGNEGYSPIRNVIGGGQEGGRREGNLLDILRHVRKEAGAWDVLDLYPLPDEDGSFEAVLGAVGRCGLKHLAYPCFTNWYVDGIDYSGEEFTRRRPASVRKSLRWNMNRLKRDGNLEFRVAVDSTTGTNPEEVDTFMSGFLDIYGKSWKGEEPNAAFLTEFAHMTVRKGWFRGAKLTINGTPVAGGYVLVHDRCVYCTKMAYDLDYRKYGVGVIWMSEFKKHLIDVDRVERIDFLRGDEAYKAQWATKKRIRKGVLVFNRTSRGAILWLALCKVAPLVKKSPYLTRLYRNLRRRRSRTETETS
jgi:hypothetical protein